MVDMEAMVIPVTDTVDTTEVSVPLMPPPKLQLKLKLSHGTDMDTVLTHMPMVDTDTHTLMEVSTILARDLLTPSPTMVMEAMVDTDMAVMVDTVMVDTEERDPLNHTTVMVDTMVVVTVMAVVMVMVMADKKLNAYII